MQPPSMWITSSLALLYLIQIVRHLGRVVHFGGDTPWSKVLNAWSIVVIVPVAICTMDPAELPKWAPFIEWMRAHAISVISVLLMASEPLLRGGQFLNIQRLVILGENSNDPKVVAEAASQLELHEVHDLAVEAHERAIDLRPDLADEHVHVAALYGILRRFKDAERAARRAISLAPESPSAHFYLGMAALEQRRLPEANAILKKAVSLGLPDVQAGIAQSVLRRGE